jgi:hypothetical protein
MKRFLKLRTCATTLVTRKAIRGQYFQILLCLAVAAPKRPDELRLAVEIRNALLFNLTGGGGIGSANSSTEDLHRHAADRWDRGHPDIAPARLRGLRDAEDRAATVVADKITSRLASYFTAGT